MRRKEKDTGRKSRDQKNWGRNDAEGEDSGEKVAGSEEEMFIWFICDGHSLSLREAKAENQGRNMESGAEAEVIEDCCLLAYRLIGQSDGSNSSVKIPSSPVTQVW